MGFHEVWIDYVRYVSAFSVGALILTVCRVRREMSRFAIAEHFPGMLKGKNREAWLLKRGVRYHFGRNMTPEIYHLVKVILGGAGFMSGQMLGLPFGVVGAFLFFLPDILLDYLNRKDNERMLPDIKMIYNSLAIQIKAGIHVTDALCECHRNIREKRLKNAFFDLAGDILMKADVFSSLERLQAQFSNGYIDSLCITILQALESGQAVEVLNDIGSQIHDMEGVLLEKKKSSLDRSITFYQLGILLAELIVVMYACVKYMFQMAANF